MAERYLYEIGKIEAEVKRTNDRLKGLKEQRTILFTALHTKMVEQNLESVGEGKNKITLKKCAPKKPRAKVKPKSERREAAISLFRETGIADPRGFLERYEQTQKTQRKLEPSNVKS